MTRWALLIPALIATLVLVALLLVACGDDGPGTSPTPEPTPTPAPEPGPCSASNLYGALISTDEAEGFQVLTVSVSNVLLDCKLSGPPTVNWYREDGTKIETPAAVNSRCQPQAGDFSTCVFTGGVLLPGEGATPAPGINGQAIAVIGVRPNPACESPAEPAHFVGLQFPGVSLDVQIELAEDTLVPTCGESIFLYGYGPTAKAAE